MPRSFLSKLVDEKNNIFLVTGDDDGLNAWYYVQTDQRKASMLLKEAPGKKTKLTDYGEILDSGWGAMPPRAIQAKYQSQES
ncbi:MAG: hypothetical protein EB060_09980 [Proteobacteria bacterium]|nr:hypothetical protein [Pseudomonadota bacterium]